MKSHRTLRVCFAVWMILVLTACSAPTVEPVSQEAPAPLEATELPTVEPTKKATATAAPEPTATFTSAPTATASLVPKLTETPMLTSTPASLTIVPGLYGVGQCESKDSSAYNVWTGDVHIGIFEVCLQGIYITKKHEMIFYVSWTLHKASLSKFYKPSAENSGWMYISDNLGKTYGHIAGGGDAYNRVLMLDGVPITGWLKFPAPQEGAYAFEFHEKVSGMNLGPMSFLEPSVRFIDLQLTHTPYILIVRDDNWKVETQVDGTSLVSHTDVPGCTVQETAYAVPQGKLKSKLDIGSVTYEIYGYILEDQNLGVREYVAVGGLEGMGEDVKPFFVVKIPLDESQRCINDVSDLMAKLSITGAE